MVDLEALRAEISAARDESAHGDLLAQTSAFHLARLFNDVVPPRLRVDTSSSATLTVHRSGGRIDGRMMVSLVDHMSRAVAAIGQELRGPGHERTIGQADYTAAPIYPTMPADGSLVLMADPAVEVAGDRLEVRTAAAFVRLANMMPEGPNDLGLASRIRSSRAPTARAMQEVALAAKRLGGIEVVLDGTKDDARGSVSPEQAQNIVDLVADSQERVRPRTVVGTLDGVRMRRREFYLLSSEREFHGSVDEDVLDRMRRLIDEPVTATLEEVTRVSAAGAVSRPAYRLVDIAPRPTQGTVV